MPMCGWCGAVAGRTVDLQNGASVVRLCPSCANSDQGLKMVATLPRILPRPEVVEDEDAPRPTPPWRLWTAILLLAVMIVPIVLALLGR